MEKIRRNLIKFLIVLLLWLHADVNPIVTNHGTNPDDEHIGI